MTNALENLQTQIASALQKLTGSRLSIARNAGNMKVFHFGETRLFNSQLVGRYALHIQCPWRLDGIEGIITGSGDFYVRADDNSDAEWEPGVVTGHLQNQILLQLLQGYDPKTRSYVNATDGFIVQSVIADGYGGFEIHLSGSYRIVVFPTGSRGEQWRLVFPGAEAEHFVVSGGAGHFE
jgi:hypothetical protein